MTKDVPQLLPLAHAVDWDGRMVMVTVDFDRHGIPRALRVDGDRQPPAAENVSRWIRGELIDLDDAEERLTYAVLDLMDQAAPMIRAAFQLADDRLKREGA